MMGHWCPPLERTEMVTVTYAGMHAGTALTLIISGYLAESLGWESIFYFWGCTACLWYVIFLFTVYDSPESHPRITEDERTYIVSSIGEIRLPLSHRKSTGVLKKFGHRYILLLYGTAPLPMRKEPCSQLSNAVRRSKTKYGCEENTRCKYFEKVKKTSGSKDCSL